MAPAFLAFLFTIVSWKTGWLFEINENNSFYLGKFIHLVELISFSYYFNLFKLNNKVLYKELLEDCYEQSKIKKNKKL